MSTTRPYAIIEKPQVGYSFGSAYEVHQDGIMVSRHPNKEEATNAIKRFCKADRREQALKKLLPLAGKPTAFEEFVNSQSAGNTK